MLVDGFKFEVRVFVLVTSVNPLEAFLYHDGFCQFSKKPIEQTTDTSLGGTRVNLKS